MALTKQQMIGANGYTPTVYSYPNQTNTAGGSAGASVIVSMATTFQDRYGSGLLPGDSTSGWYSVAINPGQSATAYATNKTSSGFSVVLTPVPSTATLAAGTFDVLVHS